MRNYWAVMTSELRKVAQSDRSNVQETILAVWYRRKKMETFLTASSAFVIKVRVPSFVKLSVKIFSIACNDTCFQKQPALDPPSLVGLLTSLDESVFLSLLVIHYR